MLKDTKIYNLYGAILNSMISKRTSVPFSSTNKNLLIVSTGPSSGKFWSNKEIRKRFSEYDLCILNDSFFHYKELMFELKPKYFCLIDSMYWGGEEAISAKMARKELN